MASRKDVAERAGVSAAAVSYVLNNKAGVSESTRKKVWAAIEELGYAPSHAARSLKTRKTYNLTVLVNYLGDPFEAGLLNHLEEKAREKGYFIHFQTYYPGIEQDLRRSVPGRIDGLLLLGQVLQPATWSMLEEEGIPVVSVTRAGGEIRQGAAWVDVDWADGMGKLIGHLTEFGHRRIALMANGSPNHPHSYRLGAFLEEMGKRGLPVGAEDILYGAGRLEQAREAMEAYIQAGRLGSHSAFIAVSDLMAAGVLTACREAGMVVPGQISIAGCENILMSHQTTPAVTVLNVYRPELASRAIDLMIRLLNGETGANSLLQAPLLIRASSDRQMGGGEEREN
jgi:DNA-binding LacI/PurR family transcriptional regulator